MLQAPWDANGLQTDSNDAVGLNPHTSAAQVLATSFVLPPSTPPPPLHLPCPQILLRQDLTMYWCYHRLPLPNLKCPSCRHPPYICALTPPPPARPNTQYATFLPPPPTPQTFRSSVTTLYKHHPVSRHAFVWCHCHSF